MGKEKSDQGSMRREENKRQVREKSKGKEKGGRQRLAKEMSKWKLQKIRNVLLKQPR